MANGEWGGEWSGWSVGAAAGRMAGQLAMGNVHRLIDWVRSALAGEGLDTTEYVRHIEREFGIVVGDDAAGRLATLGDLCAYVVAQRREQQRVISEEDVWKGVREITAWEFGINAGELHRGIRYVEDPSC